jgi:glycosyltransferase involved in cell wall biosynthesis
MEQEQTKKKIIIISPAYPYRGGQALVEAYLHKTITELDYLSSTISYKLLYPKVFFPGKTQFDSSKTIPFEHNNQIKRIINSINPFSWIKAYKEIKKEKPNAIIIVWWMFFFAPCLSTISFFVKHFMKGTKICFLAENYISHENHFYERFFVKHTFHYANSYIAESHYIYNEIKKDFPKKKIYETTLSVFDCYNLNRYDKNSARKFLNIKTENVIMFFGLIRQYKGLDSLISVFPLLLKDKPNTTLLIVGECYEDINKYKKMIQDLNIGSNIIMENRFIANEDVEPYFKATDAVIMPYYSATQSGILMMAYGFNVPVVATKVGGMQELIENDKTGIIIEDNSKENLLPAIEKMLDTKDTIPYNENIASFIRNIGYNNIGKILIDLTK